MHAGTMRLDGLWRDVRLGLRSWRRTPGVALAAVVTLALGTGATTAVFSVVSGVLLRPLPFPEPERLVQLTVSSPGDPRLPDTFVTFGDLDGWRAHARTLASLSTYSASSANFTTADAAERVALVRADGFFFATLGVDARHGRTFRPDDAMRVVVASHGFWRRQLGADPAAIGRAVTLDGQPYTLIGIMPERFEFPLRTTPTDLWVPWAPRPAGGARLDAVVGRLARDTDPGVVHHELTAISAALVSGRAANVTPILEAVARPVRYSLLMLMGAVALLLLVACANVAGLLLARAATRRREAAVRVALGAGRWPLLRQLLVESLLLAGAGGLAGLAIGRAGTGLLLALAADQLPRAAEIGFDGRVFTFLVGVTVMAGVVTGVVPAMGSLDRGAARDLQAGRRTTAPHGRLQQGLVVVEIALAFVLLIGAGLLLRTFLNLEATPTGFDTRGVLTLHVAVSGAEESRALVEQVSRIPGVEAAGFISLLPLQSSNWSGRFTIEGRPGEGSAEFRYVTPDYFRAMRIPIVRGRALTPADTDKTERMLLVNQAFAARYLPNEDPVGYVLADRGRIVGVVGDVRQSRLERPAEPEIYYPVAQNFAQLSSLGSTMVVRSGRAAGPLVEDIRRVVRDVRPGQAIFRVEPLERVVAQSIGSQRLYLWLLGLFAAIGLLLAATGVYALIAYQVALRTREYGIRAALGADPARLRRLVVGRGGLLAAAGLFLGMSGALGLTRFLQTMLYGVEATDIATFAGSAAALALAALAACIVPARRAARVDPVVVLRPE
jgi:predicted permease